MSNETILALASGLVGLLLAVFIWSMRTRHYNKSSLKDLKPLSAQDQVFRIQRAESYSRLYGTLYLKNSRILYEENGNAILELPYTQIQEIRYSTWTLVIIDKLGAKHRFKRLRPMPTSEEATSSVIYANGWYKVTYLDIESLDKVIAYASKHGIRMARGGIGAEHHEFYISIAALALIVIVFAFMIIREINL